MTAELLNAAAVSGYEALVDPNEDRVITDDTFSSREEIEKEINSLQGQTILVFDLRGEMAAGAGRGGLCTSASDR